LATARPGMIEADVLARLTQVALASRGALAFPAIATTKASILHAHSYDRVLEEGGLFLVDAGAETEMGYAADLSTSFPIGSRFDARQREIYEIVLAASSLASSMLRPGLAFRDLHFAAAKALSTGLKELGLMKGDLDEAVRAGAHALFFPTGLGHMLGLDVHDMESYGEVWVGYDGEPKSELFGLKSLRLAKPLKPGMVLTIEPGIYFIPELVERWKAEGRFSEFIAYERIAAYMAVGGIRNEEDWVVTAEGARRLGPRFDKSLAAIEAARA
jgi:Xaa-Pro aminopeptidase